MIPSLPCFIGCGIQYEPIYAKDVPWHKLPKWQKKWFNRHYPEIENIYDPDCFEWEKCMKYALMIYQGEIKTLAGIN